ncbi:MAG: hypothetical protein II744_04940 [Eubacterium sp.]|nr:hypothetical protein [Eubacterium sp.]
MKKIVIAVVAVICIAAIALGIGIKAHNKANKPVEYNVQSLASVEFEGKDDIKLIAHRGLRAIAPENTIPAFQRATEAGYWAAECDVYRTKDGVWVLMHDDTVNRMTDGKGKVEEKTYDELMKYTIDNGNSLSSYPDTKIPTLDEYLTECDGSKMNAFIELKGDNNIEHYNEIIETVKKHKSNVTYISFGAENLKAIRKLDDKATLFLLVHKITDDSIKTAKEIGCAGIDFNVSEKSNLKKDGAAIKKITDAGLIPAAWTVDDTELLKTLAGYGVQYITTDCITY